MGNNDSNDADLCDGIDDIHLPRRLTSIDELFESPAIIHIKPKNQANVLKLEDVSPTMSSSPTERISTEDILGSMPSSIERRSRELSSKKSSVYFEPSVTERPSMNVNQDGHCTRRSKIISSQEGRSRRAGPTAPRPSPTVSSVALNIKKKERPGPTIPGPTAPLSDGDNPEDSSWESSSGCSIDKFGKRDMQNWTDEWKGVNQVQGLHVDEKSDPLSECEINDFFKHKAAQEDNIELSKPRRQNSRTSIRSRFSALSALSSLSANFRARSKSLLSNASSKSDKSNASSCVRIQTFSDLMPKASWASPHYKDYEEEPYDPYKLSRSRKTNGSFK